MNIDNGLGSMFQEQMNQELENMMGYESIEASLKMVPWNGFAKFFHAAGQEEFGHYEKFNDFLVDRNVTPAFSFMPQPIVGSSSPLEACRLALQLEQTNTARLLALRQACKNAEDEAASDWLIWALKEQVDAEKELTDLIRMLELAGSNDASIRLIDERLGK